MGYRIFVNETRTIMVRIWDSGTMEVAFRETAYHTWGPPVIVTEEA